MIASYCFCRASSAATTGISQDPGTFTMSTDPDRTPVRRRASRPLRATVRDKAVESRNDDGELQPARVQVSFNCSSHFYFPVNTGGPAFQKRPRALPTILCRCCETERRGFETQSFLQSARSVPMSTASIASATATGPFARMLARSSRRARPATIPQARPIHQPDPMRFLRVDAVTRQTATPALSPARPGAADAACLRIRGSGPVSALAVRASLPATATRSVHAIASSSPPPSANPLTAATDGLRISSRRRNMRCPTRRKGCGLDRVGVSQFMDIGSRDECFLPRARDDQCRGHWVRLHVSERRIRARPSCPDSSHSASPAGSP